MKSSGRYENYFLKKKMAESGVEDLSGPIGEGVAKTDWLGRSNLTQNENVVPMTEQVAGAKPEMSGGVKGGMAAASTAVQGGNALDTASAGLMASGNPKAMAAGLALQTVSQINKNKVQREQNRYLAEVQRVKARQDAIDRLASIGQNLRA